MLRRLQNIDLQELDFDNFVRRRNNQGPPPDKGGYNMFCTLIDRSLPNVHPLGNLAIRADGKEPINGWANSPRIEELRARYWSKLALIIVFMSITEMLPRPPCWRNSALFTAP